MAKRKNAPGPSSNRYRAAEILALIGAQKGPVNWRTLSYLAAAETPKLITQLRQMLKGLQRTGELLRDQEGAYHLPDGEARQEATVERRGRVLVADGLPIEDAQKFSLRPGDVVEMRAEAERALILRVVSFSDTPVTGILRKRGRYPYVDALGDFRGKVSLLEAPVVGADGDSVQVRIVDRDRRGLVGIVENTVDSDGVLDQAINTAVTSADLPNEWPAAVIAAVKALPKSVAPGRYPHRVDLTTLALVTIDGATAKDFDDAVFAELLVKKGAKKSGGFRLVVAIADVGHYVKRGAPLDDEALTRGTSVYFPERVIPMLPEEISNGLCSLRPETARLALVCDMRIDARGHVEEHDFYEAVVHSHARLTYNQVQAFLDTGEAMPVAAEFEVAVIDSVTCMAQLYERMRGAREKRGALDFPSREADIEIRDGRIAALHPVQRLTAHQLIEEAMIAANVCAAQFLEAQTTPALYRVHEPPDPMKVEELRQALSYVGVRMQPGDVTPATLQAALQQLPDHVDHWIYAQLALRTLKQAVYTPANDGHFGLALERYMHFTSPIRRYPDLIVHRAIKHVLAKRQGQNTKAIPSLDELHGLGEQCSTFERRAESAGWLVDAWLKCDFLKDRVGESFDGLIAGVTEFGLFVELKGFFVQGLLHISNLGSDYYVFEPRVMALVGERSGQRFALGDELRVTIREVDPPQGRLDLVLERAPIARKETGSRPGGVKNRSKHKKPDAKAARKTRRKKR